MWGLPTLNPYRVIFKYCPFYGQIFIFAQQNGIGNDKIRQIKVEKYDII